MKLKLKKLQEWGITFDSYLMIAGPCSAETEDQVMETVQALAKHRVHMIRAGIWKPRTRPNTFEGVGEEALVWLKNAADQVNLPVTVEVAKPEHVEACLKIGIDVLWIGARTTSNPFAVQAIADRLLGVDIPVLVKNPINPELALWIGALERLNAVGIKRMAAVHRGFSSYEKSEYRNNPFWSIPIELRRTIPEIPLICDPSHICGISNRVEAVAQTALDLLYDGLMIEVHLDPANAFSDNDQQLTPTQFGEMIQRLKVKSISSENQEYQTTIRILREEMDRIDSKLIDLLAKRMEVSQKMAICKSQNTISTFQPNRWNEILQRIVQIATKRDLPEEFILNIYRFIHEESIRQQEIVLSSNKNS